MELDTTFSIGNVITIIIFVVGLIVQYYKLKSKVDIMQAVHDLKIETIDSSTKSLSKNITEGIERLSKKFTYVNKRLSTVELNCVKYGHSIDSEIKIKE